ncbi:alpha/beta fold hydrolase [Streptomyces sp. NPDC005799]|uniref:thioesterase II family protein n=1 Tax=Streptomyces sp. NPDC005799 TaxID=3154678 RepID=UPI0033D1B292
MTAVKREPNAWIRQFHPAPEACTRLLCLPHAGGSASFYFPLSAALSPAVEVCAVQYPGRGERLNETTVDNLDTLAAHIVDALAPWREDQLALFGHSMGAALAFEVAGLLEARNSVPTALFVSACRAPSRPRAGRVHLMSDSELRAEIGRLKGTDSRLLDDDDLLRLFLPAIRSDFKAIETYVHRRGPALSCPVFALYGDRDAGLTRDDMAAWRSHTRGEFELTEFPGGHFYLSDQIPAVAEIVSTRLQRPQSPPRHRKEGHHTGDEAAEVISPQP